MVAHPHVQRVASLHMRRRVAQLPHSGDRRTGDEHNEVCRCRRCNPICHALYCSEHVGTSTASAGRMPDGGAEQRQHRRGEDGPSQQKRAFFFFFWTCGARFVNCESVCLRNGHGRAPV